MVANFSAKVTTMLISIVLIPIYVHILGYESYGLVSFQVVLQVVFSFLELGLPATITREMGRRDDCGQENYYPNLICTIERLIWGIGLVVVISIACSSWLIAIKWLQVENLPTSVVAQSVAMMGGIIAIQLSSLVYGGGLRGLERQGLLGLCTVVSAMVRGLGALLLLTIVASDVRIFIGWNLAVAAAELIIMRHLLYTNIPIGKNIKPAFRLGMLKQHWGFSSKIIYNSIILSIAAQMDKLVISKLLTVKNLGYYAIACTAAGVITVASSAIIMAVYPILCRNIDKVTTEVSLQHYIDSTKLLGIVVWPAAFFLFFFSREVLFLWTRDSHIVQNAHILLSFLAVSYCCSAVVQLPIFLALAANKMKYVLLGNLALMFFNVPLTIICVLYWGLPGAAAAALGVNFLYSVIATGMIHRDVWGGQRLRWLWDAMLLPGFISFVAAAALHSVTPNYSNQLYQFLLMGMAFALCYAAVIACRHMVAILGISQSLQYLGKLKRK